MHVFQDALLGLGLVGLATSSVYGGLVARACLGFHREREEGLCGSCNSGACGMGARQLPPVSILKPLHGDEPDLVDHLESFFNQNYPDYEILFCARFADDPGLQTARAVAARHPDIKARFFTSGEPPYANAKVASLETMYRNTTHDVLIVSDSDVHVEPDYLRAVVAPFRDPGVGAVTCLYRGVVGEGNSIWACLEGVGMSIEMPAGVLVARMLEGMQFLLGPTMAVRRECLREIGGFQALGEYCSDDFLLGKWIAERGHEVVLSQLVVDHVILNMGFMDSVRHQVRWMKSTRCSRPKGHLGSALTFAMPYALLAAATLLWKGLPQLSLLALGWGLLSRMLLAALIGGLVVNERNLLRTIVLHPLRDLMGFGYWLASYTNNRIVWRGQEYELMKEGRMHPLQVHSGAVLGNQAERLKDDPLNKEHQPALTH